MNCGILTLQIKIPGCKSLKEKRGHLKTYIARLHNQFNVSAAEIDLLDDRDESLVAIAFVSNNHSFTNSVLDKVIDYTEQNFFDIEILDQNMEFY